MSSTKEMTDFFKRAEKSLESFKGDRSSLIDVAERIANAVEGMFFIMKESHDMKMSSKIAKKE